MADGPPPPPLPPPPESSRWAWAALQPPRFYIRGHLTLHAAALYIVAAHMFLQPDLYTPDTWRGLLYIIQWAHPWGWAAAFAVVASGKLAAAILYPRLAVPAVIAGIVILIWWTVGLAAAAIIHPNGTDMRATAIPAVLAFLVLAEHFAAITFIGGRKRRWDTGGPGGSGGW